MNLIKIMLKERSLTQKCMTPFILSSPNINQNKVGVRDTLGRGMRSGAMKMLYIENRYTVAQTRLIAVGVNANSIEKKSILGTTHSAWFLADAW